MDTKDKENTKVKVKAKERATVDTRAKEKETKATATWKPVGQGNPFGYKGQHTKWTKVKEKDTKGKGKYKTFVTDVDNKDTFCKSIAESQYTIMENHHKQQQNNMITPNNGMKIHMPMMGIGGTIAWDSMDKTYSIRHNNLHYQHHKRQHQQTMQQPIQIVSGVHCQEPIMIAHIQTTLQDSKQRT